MNLKSQLRFFLKEQRLTASDLARQAGIRRQVISDWMAGKSPRSVEHLRAVAEILKTTVDNLCFGEGRPKTSENAFDIGDLMEDGWIGGVFEVKMRRLKRGKE